MNLYEKKKDSILNYLHSEEGKKHMKEAQRKYRKTEEGKKKNIEITMRWYWKQKEKKTIWNEEITRLNAISIF
jgi:hypothetical protein